MIEPQPNAPNPAEEMAKQQAALEERKAANEESRIKVAEADTVLKTQIAQANAAKQDVEGDKLESEIELIKAKTIETLTKAGQTATPEAADALYEPKSKSK